MRLRLAVVGFGQLGRACVEAVRSSADLELAGVVRRPGSELRPPPPLEHIAVATHLRDLGGADAVLLCVPSAVATGMACEIVQWRMALVECAQMEQSALDRHYESITAAAHRHRVRALIGAGWDPGMLPLLRRAFELLVPRGQTTVTKRPAVSLHHTEAAKNIPGVVESLVAEFRDAEGRMKRYVYAQLEKAARPEAVQAAIAADPLFVGEETVLFPVDNIGALEQQGHGVLIERRGVAASGAHQSILLEARFDAATFAARVMLDAARRLGRLKPGAHRYALWGAE
jgi:diaminopimelate dehydrogenase